MERRVIKFWASLVTVVLLALLIGLPMVANAAGPTDYFPIVRCGTADNPTPCTPCGLFDAGDRVIRFILFGVTGPVAAFMLVVAGGMFLLSAANPQLRNTAKNLLTQIILGVTVILLSWTATNFLIKLLGTSADQKPWYEYSCPAFLDSIGKTTPLPSPNASTGSPSQPNAALVQAYVGACTVQALSSKYQTATSIKISSSLTQLRQCLEGDQVVKALIKSHPFTYDEDYNLCNYTHGIRTACTPTCSHSQYSCHYGGATGTQGAEAVDYSWNGKQVTYIVSSRSIVSTCPKGENCRIVGSRQDLFDELYRAAHNNDATKDKSASLKCPYKLLNYEGDHVHVSAPTCDRDGTGIKGAAAPSL